MKKAYYDLRKVKAAIAAGDAFLAQRPVNLGTIDELGYSQSDALSEIATLSVNHFRGIAWEKGRAADEYVKTIQGRRVYIKFFMENGFVVLSFHF